MILFDTSGSLILIFYVILDYISAILHYANVDSMPTEADLAQIISLVGWFHLPPAPNN